MCVYSNLNVIYPIYTVAELHIVKLFIYFVKRGIHAPLQIIGLLH